jgi:predicted oxidoreductase
MTAGSLPAAVDVLVAGSGVAGLAAAIESASAGARTLVIEASEHSGGASAMSGAACCFVDTPLQRSLDIADSVELALADWAALGGETADLAWARRYLAESTTAVHDWLADLGIVWESVGQPEGNTVPRWHVPAGWGAAIMATLAERAVALGIETRTGCAMTGLEVSDGEVVAVTVETSSGTVEIRTSAVVVATGGYVGDLARVLDGAPVLRRLPRLLAGGAPTALGLGHEVLAKVGARFAHLENVWVYPTGTPDPQDPRGERGLGLRGVTTELWLNHLGERFHDESLRGGHSGTAALLAQPGMTCWCVFSQDEADQVLLIDNEFYGTPSGPDPAAMRNFWDMSGYVWKAGTLAELAAKIGLPAVAVESAVASFNDAVRSGADRDPATGRDLAGLREVRGPFRAVQFFPMAQKNFGGVATDTDCAVLADDGSIIRGLFAAGEVAGMAGGSINGRAGLEGTMFGPCAWSGRLAGAAAAGHRTRHGG